MQTVFGIRTTEGFNNPVFLQFTSTVKAVEQSMELTEVAAPQDETFKLWPLEKVSS